MREDENKATAQKLMQKTEETKCETESEMKENELSIINFINIQGDRKKKNS